MHPGEHSHDEEVDGNEPILALDNFTYPPQDRVSLLVGFPLVNAVVNIEHAEDEKKVDYHHEGFFLWNEHHWQALNIAIFFIAHGGHDGGEDHADVAAAPE